MDEEKIYKALAERIEKAGSIRKFAKEIGMSATFISFVVRRDAKLTPKLMAALGFEKQTKIVKSKVV